jgi:hypothetical protein
LTLPFWPVTTVVPAPRLWPGQRVTARDVA